MRKPDIRQPSLLLAAQTAVRWRDRILPFCLPPSLFPSLIPPSSCRGPKIAPQSATGPKAKSQSAKSPGKKEERKLTLFMIPALLIK